MESPVLLLGWAPWPQLHPSQRPPLAALLAVKCAQLADCSTALGRSAQGQTKAQPPCSSHKLGLVSQNMQVESPVQVPPLQLQLSIGFGLSGNILSNSSFSARFAPAPCKGENAPKRQVLMEGAKDGRAPPQRQQCRYTHHTSFFQLPSKLITAKSRPLSAHVIGCGVRPGSQSRPLCLYRGGPGIFASENNPSYIRAQGY